MTDRRDEGADEISEEEAAADNEANKASAASFPASDPPASWASEPGADPVPSSAPGLLRPHTERSVVAAEPFAETDGGERSGA